MAFFFSLAAGPRPRGRVAHTEEAVYTIIRCGRGEAAFAEPGRGARGAVLACRLRVVGVRAVLFFVTLGTVLVVTGGIAASSLLA